MTTATKTLSVAAKKRFDAAWKLAADEYRRLMQQHLQADKVPASEWEKYERLEAKAMAVESWLGR